MFRKIAKTQNRTKFINYLRGFHKYLFWKIPPNMILVIPRETPFAGFHFSKFGCCKPTTYAKKLYYRVFLFLELGEFLQNRHKEQPFLNSSENIFLDILSELCLNGVLMSRCQLLWLSEATKSMVEI